ncbi:uncharacterized protein [Amphiura filiformis]|uniref:uncharacterized protein n=1 Tax=Amphiura filiformis TaxID=82378 RepID=UPI003B216312
MGDVIDPLIYTACCLQSLPLHTKMATCAMSDFYVEEDFENLEFEEDSPAPDSPNVAIESPASFHEISATLNDDESSDESGGEAIEHVEESIGQEHQETTTVPVHEPPKKNNRTRRVRTKRTKRFTLEDATNKSFEYVASVLQKLPTEPLFTKPFKNVKLALALSAVLLTFVADVRFAEFCTYLVTHLWHVVTAGDNKPLSYAQTLVTHFHSLCTNEELFHTWDSLLDSFGITRGQLESDIILQHTLDSVLELLLSDRNAVDLPTMQSEINFAKLSKHEEQVLNYVGGYIPSALRKHYKKSQNLTSQKYVDILNTWCTDGHYEGQYSFLQYTQEWINAQNRGKLFKPNAELYLFFRALENETRKHLNTALLGKYRDINLREFLIQKLTTKYLVQSYWSRLVNGKCLSSTESKHLFYVIVNYFVNIRIKAFVVVFIDLKKVQDKTLSRKGSKSLRKQLDQNKES